MRAGTAVLLALSAATLISTPAAQTRGAQPAGSTSRPDFDIRDRQSAAPTRVTAEARAAAGQPGERRGPRLNRESGTARLLEDPGLSAARGAAPQAIRGILARNAHRLGLEPPDLDGLTLTRDYTSRSTGVRHVTFAQVVDGHTVFDSSITIHLRADGSVLRITSNAAPIEGRESAPLITSAAARARAVEETAGAAPGDATLAWLPVSGTLRLAWHVVVPVDGAADLYDVLIDAQTGELLIRRNRARHTEGTGRLLQSPATIADDARRPDPMPFGADGTPACPPPVNHSLRSLNAPFRDPATVLDDSGHLEGNNAQVFRGSTAVRSEAGTLQDGTWLFDFPFNSAPSAETSLFFAVNYAHDFFYDLGFDEAAGNFQADNFDRGGLGGDPLKANARAAGRNNANYVHAPDGSSPTMNMFLWDGTGCWGDDVDADGTPDLDGDYDLDIILHEYHHGVSLRLNTAFTGNEAGAIGEGGGDFFAYSINGNPLLAEYAYAGGLRTVNGKDYNDWTCLLGLFCDVHSNGEIWANVMWDARERFRLDAVGGSESSGVTEVHQLYIDALTLSPPAPTMLDLRDAILEADTLRHGDSGESEHSCRIWESFAGRGMGVSATDTADNGFNRVVAAYDVPAGCVAPPPPPAVTVTATVPAAFEAGQVPAVVTFRREAPTDRPLTVIYSATGTAAAGTDYAALSGTAVIEAGATEVAVPIVPMDDGIVENNESLVISVARGSGYTTGTPGSATITIVSDDVAPDLVVPALSAPRTAGSGDTITVSCTVKNNGSGAAPASQTSFYLSANAILDTGDALLGSSPVGALAPGAEGTCSASLVLPSPLDAGQAYLFAKADGPAAIAETNELNNTRAAAISIGPDLAVSALSVPAAGAAGGAIAVTDTTINQGAGAARASATRMFLSANVFLDAADVALDARNVPALAPGASSIATTPVVIPAGTPAGSYYLFAKADAAGDVGESNETNNARSGIIRIGPDLTVSSLSVPARGAAGAPLAITDTTRNAGAGSAGASLTTFYLSDDLTLDAEDFRLGPSRQVPPLGPSGTSTGTTSVTLPDVAPGAWYVLAQADDAQSVAEARETNNVRAGVVQIGPDLNFLGISAPTSATAGASISVTAIVRNSGAGAAGASVVRFYLSTNSVRDEGDVELAAVREVPVLAGGATNSAATVVPIPSGSTGTFYLLVVADADGAVAESSEKNNVAARFLTVK